MCYGVNTQGEEYGNKLTQSETKRPQLPFKSKVIRHRIGLS